MDIEARLRFWVKKLFRDEHLRGRVALAERFFVVREWVASWEPADEPLISVVLPTYNRAAMVQRALRSVLRQSYGHFEAVVVVDGSTDNTREVLASFADERVVVVERENGGLALARNTGIDRARGEILTYLDDDNAMHPDWLKTVAWAFEHYPNEKAMYGARLIEDDTKRGVAFVARHDAPRLDFPRLDYFEYDPVALRRQNYIDINVIAHRAGLPEGHFYDDFGNGCDYRHVLSLSERYGFLSIPAVACAYATRNEDRMSHDPQHLANYQMARNALRAQQAQDANKTLKQEAVPFAKSS